MRYSKLNAIIERRLFDPAKRADQLELKYYMMNGKWENKCPFYAEYPYEDVPTMCKDKYTLYQLNKVKSP